MAGPSPARDLYGGENRLNKQKGKNMKTVTGKTRKNVLKSLHSSYPMKLAKEMLKEVYHDTDSIMIKKAR